MERKRNTVMIKTEPPLENLHNIYKSIFMHVQAYIKMLIGTLCLASNQAYTVRHAERCERFVYRPNGPRVQCIGYTCRVPSTASSLSNGTASLEHSKPPTVLSPRYRLLSSIVHASANNKDYVTVETGCGNSLSLNHINFLFQTVRRNVHLREDLNICC